MRKQIVADLPRCSVVIITEANGGTIRIGPHQNATYHADEFVRGLEEARIPTSRK